MRKIVDGKGRVWYRHWIKGNTPLFNRSRHRALHGDYKGSRTKAGIAKLHGISPQHLADAA